MELGVFLVLRQPLFRALLTLAPLPRVRQGKYFVLYTLTVTLANSFCEPNVVLVLTRLLSVYVKLPLMKTAVW